MNVTIFRIPVSKPYIQKEKVQVVKEFIRRINSKDIFKHF